MKRDGWCDAVVGLVAALGFAAPAGCADGGSSSTAGGQLGLEIAPLDLPGIADAVWDIEVENNASPPERLWARRITSSRYGDGAGSASYVGPCDADPSASSNTVTVHIRGIYAAALPPNGAGEFGDAAPTGGEAFNDPGDLSRTFVCLENQDVAVQFDVSLMRPADQGFFDIAVNFNQIYCSAKFDCCDVDGDPSGDNSTCQASEYTNLLFNGTQRDRTYMLGFACTVGDGAQYNTTLMLDDLVLTCDGSAGGPAAGTYTLDVDPTLAAGNQGDVTAAHLFQWATYRGEEFVDDTVSKAYWNIALGVGNMAGCVLTTKGTADDLANAGDHVGVSGPTIDANTTYPVIHWTVDLATCTEHPLNQTASVNTTYTPTVHGGVSFDHRWIPGGPNLSCGGESCPSLSGYDMACNAQDHCEYTNPSSTGWRAYDVWIWVPPGAFEMGAPAGEADSVDGERPVHTVTIAQGYFIQKYEVTVLAYEACESAGTCSAPSVSDWDGSSWGVNRSTNSRSDHPQNGVDWYQAREVCAWMVAATGGGVGRLPSESEWELATSGLIHHRYAWGDSPDPTCSNDTAVMNEAGGVGGYGCGHGGTWPVGSKPAGVSPIGALDLAGNLWEWSEDCLHDDYISAPTDGSAWTTSCSDSTYRIKRGGSYLNSAQYMREAHRNKDRANYHSANYGARCVREASP